MTTRVNVTQTCDRCERPFNQKMLKGGDKVPEIKSKGLVLYATTTVDGDTTPAAKPLVEFEDLCDACREAVMKMVERMNLDSKKKPAAEGKKRGRPSKAEIEARKAKAAEEKAAAEPQTSDYTEPEAEASEPVPSVETGGPPAITEEPEPEPEAAKDVPKAKESAKDVLKAALGPQDASEGEESEDLGLAGDDNAKARKAADAALEVAESEEDEAFPGHETFEDPDTGDIIDVHTGEVLAKRVDGGGVVALEDGKMPEDEKPEGDSAHPF